jgi:hypothetical protein
LRKRIRRERQTDRQACENNGQIERQACEQDGRTYLERGFGNEWKDKLGDRLLKRIEDKLRDRLVSKNNGQIKRQASEKYRKKIFAIFRFFFVSLISRSGSLQIFAVSLCENIQAKIYLLFASKGN